MKVASHLQWPTNTRVLAFIMAASIDVVVDSSASLDRGTSDDNDDDAVESLGRVFIIYQDLHKY